jgi:hypothetical protein
MRNFIIYLAVLLCLFVSKSYAQETNQKAEIGIQTFNEKVKIISAKIDNVTKSEKEALRREVESVNEELEEGKITVKEAEEKKKAFAIKRADNIAEKVAQYEEELKDLIQQKANGKLADKKYRVDTLTVNGTLYSATMEVINDDGEIKRGRFTVKLGNYWETDKKRRDSIMRNRSELRTTSQFVFAAGVNNLVTDGSVADSDYRYLGSHFYEWGITGNTRIFKNNNLLHAKYGFSVMYNNLRPTDNRFFVVDGKETNLEEFEGNLKDSRFRNVYVSVPLHLEFDFTKKKINEEGKSIFKTHRGFRLGIGGYAGFRVKSKQILKFEEDDIKYKIRQKGDFNVNDFIYGLSAYVGYKETSLYIKYDLNPMFKDNAIKQNNVSLGVRFDLN